MKTSPRFSRRAALRRTALSAAALVLVPKFRLPAADDVAPVLGQGAFRYRAVPGWGVLGADTPVKDCHAMVQDRRGRLILLTNETRNNVIFYDKGGKLLGTWGREYPGAHGMTLVNENGEEFLFLTDHDRHQVYKTTLDGKVLFTLDAPRESGRFPKDAAYKPTDVAVAPNGDFYVLDGYGTSLILHYTPRGELRHVFGGRGTAPENVNEAHGGVVDTRDAANPTLLVTSRQDSSLKRFALDGKYLGDLPLPNTLPCDIILRGEFAFVPQLRMRDGGSKGFVTVLDGKNRVVSNPGGEAPRYDGDGTLRPLQRASELFTFPHGLCVDDEDSVYVAQWNSGRTYPIKLARAA